MLILKFRSYRKILFLLLLNSWGKPETSSSEKSGSRMGGMMSMMRKENICTFRQESLAEKRSRGRRRQKGEQQKILIVEAVRFWLAIFYSKIYKNIPQFPTHNNKLLTNLDLSLSALRLHMQGHEIFKFL